jgi:hypothetical protein
LVGSPGVFVAGLVAFVGSAGVLAGSAAGFAGAGSVAFVGSTEDFAVVVIVGLVSGTSEALGSIGVFTGVD